MTSDQERISRLSLLEYIWKLNKQGSQISLWNQQIRTLGGDEPIHLAEHEQFLLLRCDTERDEERGSPGCSSWPLQRSSASKAAPPSLQGAGSPRPLNAWQFPILLPLCQCRNGEAAASVRLKSQNTWIYGSCVSCTECNAELERECWGKGSTYCWWHHVYCLQQQQTRAWDSSCHGCLWAGEVTLQGRR